ncbi:Phosphatidate cytidylyltransferase [Candidatus Clavichlamydia salmonicola]|uniref:phosphatidate cytidylyltransferase n=1 Tax=Candidatus Clavichlamydia salmonicola TaxID=469812 RepID=UPI001890B6D8|nr:phosphatidate cytidylyltransferase [Candidatus Clavichlamydia salmonicola]MBF5051023.1 Phosphatidate cytidylyltransferase [Candidatus Clavichlamydia salmonicola]
MKKIKLQNLSQRTITHSLSITVVLGLLLTANLAPMKWIMAGIMSILSAWTTFEFLAIAKKKGSFPAIIEGSIISAGFVFLSFITDILHLQDSVDIYTSIPWIFLFIILPTLCFVKYASLKASPIINTGVMFFGILYTAVPFKFALEILYGITKEGSPHQRIWWLAFILATTKSGDLFGYFFGSIFGKRKLAPKISPNKTIVGAVGGLLGSLFVAVIFFITLPKKESSHTLTLYILLGFATILCLAGIFGDLLESMFKRDAAVKDSGSFKGVGGFLDNMDALLLSIPLAYLMLKILNHTNLYFLF